ncbi:hypothetical protein CGSHi3655_00861, partial [Haemophilus influenzae 3655]
KSAANFQSVLKNSQKSTALLSL